MGWECTRPNADGRTYRVLKLQFPRGVPNSNRMDRLVGRHAFALPFSHTKRGVQLKRLLAGPRASAHTLTSVGRSKNLIIARVYTQSLFGTMCLETKVRGQARRARLCLLKSGGKRAFVQQHPSAWQLTRGDAAPPPRRGASGLKLDGAGGAGAQNERFGSNACVRSRRLFGRSFCSQLPAVCAARFDLRAMWVRDSFSPVLLLLPCIHLHRCHPTVTSTVRSQLPIAGGLLKPAVRARRRTCSLCLFCVRARAKRVPPRV